jgi:AcrR family transcriptional regulator
MKTRPGRQPKTKPKRRTSAETREHVLRVTQELFYWNGIRAIGVDRIAAEAGIAPTQLYRLFASKDDLIDAYVERADRLYRAWFTEAMEKGGAEPRARILAVFDALTEQVRPAACRGCLFLMALSEIPESERAAHLRAVGTKRWVRAQFAALVDAAAPSVPRKTREALADQLTLITEGVYASVQALGTEGPAARARSLVVALLSGIGATTPQARGREQVSGGGRHGG